MCMLELKNMRLNLLGLSFLICNIEIIIAPTSYNCVNIASVNIHKALKSVCMEHSNQYMCFISSSHISIWKFTEKFALRYISYPG